MSARRITTLVGAARYVGVTPATIRSWVTKGWLSNDRSWTPRQIEKARDQSRQTLGRGSTAAHGTPSRWRAGCPCDECKRAHNADLASWRDTQAG